MSGRSSELLGGTLGPSGRDTEALSGTPSLLVAKYSPGGAHETPLGGRVPRRRDAHTKRIGELSPANRRTTSSETAGQRHLPAYLDLLETLYLTHRLPPWGDNLTKRVTSRPKVALLDTGLAARLNHVTPEAMAPGSVGDAAGGLLESFVAGELRRQLVWSDTPARLFHFRDRNGLEVDIVVESDARRVAGVEMKAAGSVSSSDFKGLTFLRDKLRDRFALGVVLYTGRRPLPFGDRLWALPYSALWTGR